MTDKKLPKILVVSTNAWRDNTGINTLIEFFKCWDNDRIAQIYAKSALPKTSVCNKFFRISENAVMKSVFKRNIKTGMEVQNETTVSDADKEAANEEKNLYKHGGKKASLILSICRELVWWIGKWKTKELDKSKILMLMFSIFLFIQQFIWADCKSILSKRQVSLLYHI